MPGFANAMRRAPILWMFAMVVAVAAPSPGQTWHQKPFMAGHPASLSVRGFATADDPVRGRLVLFGSGQTWEWDGSTWAQRFPAQSPPQLHGHAMGYDATQGRVLLFGGTISGSQVSDETWSWDGFSWTRLNVNVRPRARTGHAMASNASGRIVLFGGRSSPTNRRSVLNDTFEWTGSAWEPKDPTARPPGRELHAMAWDASTQRMLLFGGFNLNTALGDTWSWDGNNWVAAQPPQRPIARYGHAMVSDPIRGRVLLYGGHSGSIGAMSAEDDTWEWNGATWARVGSNGRPGPRQDHALAYDAARQRVLLIGGGLVPCMCTATPLADTWQWDGAGWRAVDGLPLFRVVPGLAVDTARDRVVLYGGASGSSDTWEWDGYRWHFASATSAIGPRQDHAMAYDAARGEVVLFGGGPPAGIGRSDTWVWDGASWTRRLPANTPPARSRAAMAYDAARGQLVLFGGTQWWSGGSGARNDTWVWDGSNWTAVDLSVKPAPRDGHAMTYDPVRQRVVLFGGRARNDTWEWDGSTWSQQNPTTRPAARWGHKLAYHPQSGSVVLQGGQTGDPDTWLWDGADWTRFPVPAPTSFGGYGSYVAGPDAGGKVVSFVSFGSDVSTWVFDLSVARASAAAYGTGCGGPAGAPALESVGLPLAGRSGFALDVGPTAAGTAGAVFLSVIPASLQLANGCTLLVDPSSALTLPIIAGSTGAASARIPLPTTASFLGVTLFAQSAVIEPLGPLGGISLSRGLEFTIGQ